MAPDRQTKSRCDEIGQRFVFKLQSLWLGLPLVRGQFETPEVAQIAGRQAMLDGTFNQQAEVTWRRLSTEADPV